MSSKVTPIDQHHTAADSISDASSECTVRVVLRAASGADDHQWTIPHDGATLGSADDCELVCKADDIAPRHLQFFLRSEGIAVHDLVRDVPQLAIVSWAEEAPCTLQIAGHQLELRAISVQPQTPGPSPESSEEPTGDAEAVDVTNSVEHEGPSVEHESVSTGRPIGELASEESDPEHQEILETLEEIQRDSSRAQALQHELASQAESASAPAPNPEADSSADEPQDARQRSSDEETILEQQTAREAAALDLIGERVSDVDQQLRSLEHLIAEDQALDYGEPTSASDSKSDAFGRPDTDPVSTPSAATRGESDADEPVAPAPDRASGGPGPFNTQLVLLRESLASWTTQQAEQASTMSFPDENRADERPTQAQDPSREWSKDASQTVEQLASLTAETITKLSQAVGENWQEEIQQQFELLRQAVDQAAAAVLDKGTPESTHVEAMNDNEVFETSPAEPVEDYDKPPELEREATLDAKELPSWWTEDEARGRASDEVADTQSDASTSEGTPESEVFETSPTPDLVHEYDRANSAWQDSSESSTDANSPEDAHWTSETDDFGSQDWSSNSEESGDEESQRNFFEGMGEDSIAEQPEPPATDSAATEVGGVEEEESVEEYMQKLLARMRGTAQPTAGTKPVVQPPQSSPSQRTPAAVSVEAATEPSQSDTAALHDTAAPQSPASALAAKEMELKVLSRRTSTPEKTQNLAAMRELANSSARTAIHHSTRQRQLLDLVVKATIAVIGLVVGLVLLIINGLSLNLGLLATIAALFVAGIWGYDFVSTLKPLVQAGIVLNPVPAGESADEPGSKTEPAPAPPIELDAEEKSES